MRRKRKKAGILILLAFVAGAACVGGGMYGKGRTSKTQENEESSGNTQEDALFLEEGWRADDVQVDFRALKEKNPEIFAWIFIPGTTVDCPVLQSGQSDTFYENHNADGEKDDTGAVYIELANLPSMCDFNTVLHGKTGTDEKGPFADLYRFADPDFFDSHEFVYLYLDGNMLVYEIFAACERENTSLIRTYDFTYLSGCKQFLDDLYATRDMSMNLREGWEDVDGYNYVITLTTQKEGAQRQFVVAAVLIEDTAGTIDRMVIE